MRLCSRPDRAAPHLRAQRSRFLLGLVVGLAVAAPLACADPAGPVDGGRAALALGPNTAANDPPEAAFVVATRAPVAKSAVTFDASASADPDSLGDLSSWEWDFGDARTATRTSARGQVHAFDTAGTYAVRLRLRDRGGLADDTTILVTVAPGATGGYATSPAIPEAGVLTTFTAAAPAAPSGNPPRYWWTWADGAIDTGRVVTKTFPAAGLTSLTLTVQHAGAPRRILRDTLRVGAAGGADLFVYDPGDNVAAKGGTFLRSGGARYYDAAGVQRVAAAGVLRDAHYVNGTRTLLLEGARTNAFTYSDDLAQTAWTKTRVTVSAADGTKLPDATTAAYKVVPSTASGTHTLSRSVSTSEVMASTAWTSLSVALKAGGYTAVELAATVGSATYRGRYTLTGTGTATATAASSALVTPRVTIRAHANGWYHASLTFSSGDVSTVGATVAVLNAAGATSYAGDGASGVYVGNAQVETNQGFATSYIATGAAPVRRSADSLSFPINAPLQPLTIYTKFIEVGPANDPGAGSFYHLNTLSDASAANIALTTGVTPAPDVFSSPFFESGYTVRAFGSPLNVSPGRWGYGQRVEHRIAIALDESFNLGATVDGGPETIVAEPGEGTSLPTWQQPATFEIGEAFNNNNFSEGPSGAYEILRLRIARGAKMTMADAR